MRALPPRRGPQRTDGHTDEGEELIVGPNQVIDLPPGHVTWVEGDEVLEMVDWAGGAGFDTRPGGEARAMATILFTDVVDSTALARDAGDASWKRTVAMHEDVVRSVLAGFGGREVETAGDSFLVVFDSAEGAIRCGLALVEALGAIQFPIRVGIHSGEVVMSGDDVRGLAVPAAARIVARAGAGEVLEGSGARARAVRRGIGRRIGVRRQLPGPPDRGQVRIKMHETDENQLVRRISRGIRIAFRGRGNPKAEAGLALFVPATWLDVRSSSLGRGTGGKR